MMNFNKKNISDIRPSYFSIAGRIQLKYILFNGASF